MGNIQKDRIIETAILLFNKNGYASVTMRDIAGALRISPGHLTYYFKKKEDLINAIVRMQYDGLKQGFTSIPPEDVTVEELNRIFLRSVERQKKYFFYFYDVTELPRKYPEIAKIQVEAKAELYGLIQGILKSFVRRGIMKEEPREGAYDDLSFAILSVAAFWVQQNSLENDPLSGQKNVLSVLWNLLLPNFTEGGLRLYNELNLEKNVDASDKNGAGECRSPIRP